MVRNCIWIKNGGAVPFDRPDLIACVFNLNLKELFDDLVNREVFGEANGLVHAFGYQKRGLPHAHIAVILSESDRIKTANDVATVEERRTSDVV